MKLIYPYKIELVEYSKLNLPVASEILSIEVIDNELWAHVMINQNMNKRTDYEFKIVNPKEELGKITGYLFRGSFRLKTMGVVYVFEKEKVQK